MAEGLRDLASNVTAAYHFLVDQARKALSELAEKLELGENDPEVTRLRTLLDFMEGEP